MRLLPVLAQELREYRLATGRPPGRALLIAGVAGTPWDKWAWQRWRTDRWGGACRRAGLDPPRRPYDLRHSFASLLLAEGQQPVWVARQLGHSVAVLLSTYAHLIDEYAAHERIDVEREIAIARQRCTSGVRYAGGESGGDESAAGPNPALGQGFDRMGDPGLEPGTSSLSEKRSNRLS